MKYVLVYLGSVFISAVSQIILKKSAMQNNESILKEYLNIKVIVAYFIFFVSSLLTIYAYKGVPLSMGAMLETTGYFWVAVLGRLFLKEEIGYKKIVGLSVIIIGIIIAV